MIQNLTSQPYGFIDLEWSSMLRASYFDVKLSKFGPSVAGLASIRKYAKRGFILFIRPHDFLPCRIAPIGLFALPAL